MHIKGLSEKEDYKRRLIAEIKNNLDYVQSFKKGLITIYVVPRNTDECMRLLQEYADFFCGGMPNETVDGISITFSNTDEASAFYGLIA